MILIVFIVLFFLYYLFSNFVLKPNRIIIKGKINAIYDSYAEAKPFIVQQLKKASNIRILLRGGSAISADSQAELLDILRTRALEGATEIRILLGNPYSENNLKRIHELESHKPQRYSREVLQGEAESNTKKIMFGESKIKVRYYENLPIWRMFILDDIAIISSYLSSKEGHKTQEIVLEKGTDLFDAFLRIFDDIWDNAKFPRFGGQ